VPGTSVAPGGLVDVFDDGCLYQPGVIATSGALDPDVDLIPDYEGNLQPLNQVDAPPETEAFLDSAPSPELIAGLDIFFYETGDLDPLDVARYLEGQGKVASPIQLVQPNGHIVLAPGTSHTPTAFPLNVETTEVFDDSDPVVAVVDTGYDPGSGPAWLNNRVRLANPNVDVDNAVGTDFESHAAFIASLIVQFDPSTQVYMAGLPNLQPLTSQFTDSVGGSLVGEAQSTVQSTPFTSTEYFLLGAIERLLAVDGASAYDALNFSGGTYQCEFLTSSGFITWAALEHWYSSTDGKPVVAAAGNRTADGPAMSDEYKFVPGQFSLSPNGGTVYGVASVDDSGQLSSFSNWAEYTELGEDLCGVHTTDPANGTLWGGSSFATAIAAAKVANNLVLTRSQPLPPSTTQPTSSPPSAAAPPPSLPGDMESTLNDCRGQG
jgi:hypothetical protein